MGDHEQVAGRVTAPGGAVPRTVVSVVASTRPLPEVALVVAADGRFVVALPPGTHTLEAVAADGRRVRQTVTTPGAGAVRLDLGDGPRPAGDGG